MKKIARFIRDTAKAAVDATVKFFKGLVAHAEAATVLTLSSIGLTGLLAEVPFYVALPMWIEAPMVIPFISVCTILLLLRLAKWRKVKQFPRFAYQGA